MRIKKLTKPKKKWNPDDVVEKEFQRLPQLNKFYKKRSINGFGG